MSITLSVSAVEDLIEEIKKPGENLAPECLYIEKQRIKDDELWRAIGGVSGLWRMFFDAGILFAMSYRLNQMVDARAQHDHDRDLAFIVRAATFFAFLECVLLAGFPRLPIPRFIARFAVDQYCELCASVRAVLEFEIRDLVKRFDAVI